MATFYVIPPYALENGGIVTAPTASAAANLYATSTNLKSGKMIVVDASQTSTFKVTQPVTPTVSSDSIDVSVDMPRIKSI